MKHTNLDQLFDGAQEIITRAEAIERGLKRYFTGEPCKYGHVAERLTSRSYCCVCNNLQSKKHQSDNKNIKQLYDKRRSNIIRKTDPSFFARQSAIFRKRNPNRNSAYQQKYRNENRHKVNAWASNRRSTILSVVNLPCADAAIQKYRKNGGLCFYCSADVAPADVHCDHIIPLAKQGPHVGVNLVLSCAPCNLSKNANSPSTWRKLPEKHRRRALNREQKVLEWVENNFSAQS
jgi:5-methylcytosine-specific restriction endonuclease McrA